MPIALKTISFLLVVYVAIAIAIAMFLMQRQMLYPADTNAVSDVELTRQGLTRWPASGEAFRPYTSAVSRQDHKGTVLVFHGNAGAAYHRDYYVDALTPLGYRVLLVEYPGYGGRPGQADEKIIVDEAREIVTLAKQQFGKPLFMWGESLGAGVAAAVAADTALEIDGLVLLTPWYSLDELAQQLYWFLPVKFLLRDHYHSGNNLNDFRKPTAVLIADEDKTIPVSHSEKLFAAIVGPKKLWRFPGAGHNTWPSSPDKAWWAEVMAFVDPD